MKQYLKAMIILVIIILVSTKIYVYKTNSKNITPNDFDSYLAISNMVGTSYTKSFPMSHTVLVWVGIDKDCNTEKRDIYYEVYSQAKQTRLFKNESRTEYLTNQDRVLGDFIYNNTITVNLTCNSLKPVQLHVPYGRNIVLFKVLPLQPSDVYLVGINTNLPAYTIYTGKLYKLPVKLYVIRNDLGIKNW